MPIGSGRTRVGLVIGALGYGGAEGQLYELARALCASERFEPFVYVLSSRVEPYGSQLERAGVRLRVLPARRALDPGRVLALARALRSDRIEIVHAFLYIASAYAWLATRLAPGPRLVSSARNCKPEPSVVRRAVVRRAFAGSDAVICNSAEMARFASEYYGASAERVRVVYNGVDAGRFGAGAARRGTASRRQAGRARNGAGPVIGTVGRIERQKNLDVFLEAAACLRRERPAARFEIVGEGSERARLEARARELGLDDAVRFRGTTDDVPGFFASLEQFWLTSDWEGTPNVVLEAMAAGLPVVATRVGGTPELLDDGRTGVLVEARDPAAVCAAALRLSADPVRAHEIGAAARAAAVERFSLERMASDTADVYASVGKRP